VPPTSTPLPPTSTPLPPTSTPLPSTSTPVPPTTTPSPDPNELIVDNTSAGFSTAYGQDAWQVYTEVGGGHYGDNHVYNHLIGTGQDVATWTFTVPQAGRYDVYAWWWAGDWRPADVPYVIRHASGTETVRVSQQVNGRQWNRLGTYDFAGQGSVAVNDSATSGQDAMADAVRLVYAGPVASTPTPTPYPTNTPTARLPIPQPGQ